MRILFIGTGEIGVPTLHWLARDSGHDILGVVCQPDRPAGRRQEMTAPATRLAAQQRGLPVWQPEDIRHAVGELRQLHANVIVVMAYGQFLPGGVRESAGLACINLHASLLPRWRGASPIQAALAAGDTESGISVLHVAAEMDAGDIILTQSIQISPRETGQSLHDRLADLAPSALERALDALESGTAQRQPQNPREVTTCRRLERDDGTIDWSRPAIELERMVRAFDPWPGTTTQLPNGSRLKIFPFVEVVPLTGSPLPAGAVLGAAKHELLIKTGEGALRLGPVQPEGSRRMTPAEFLAGHHLEVGTGLG